MEVDSQALVEQNRALVFSLAKKVAEEHLAGIFYHDLVGFGMLGLCEAASSYDPSRGVSFSTYAWTRIRGALLDGLYKLTGDTRRKNRKLDAEKAATEILGKCAEETGTGLSVDEEYELLSNAVAEAGVCYIVAEWFDTDEFKNDPEQQCLDRAFLESMESAISCLSKRERDVLRMYYQSELTFDEIAASIGQSKSWVWKLHFRALKKLREYFESESDIGSC